jgi:hypothetical protein
MAQSHNPLCSAVQIQAGLYDIQSEMMAEIAGEAAFDPFDEVLCASVADLIDRALDAISTLSPRARHARLNLLWKEFVAEQKQKRDISL